MSLNNGKVGITLIGSPGSGKSTLGKRVISSLPGWNLHDHDDDGLELALRQTYWYHDISEAIQCMGDKAFLDFEETFTIMQYWRKGEGRGFDLDNTIFASSGSLVRSEKAMEHIRERTLVILLDTLIDTVIDQVTKRSGWTWRIIGMNGGPDNEAPLHTSLREELEFRKNLYEQSHDIKFQHQEWENLDATTERLLQMIQKNI